MTAQQRMYGLVALLALVVGVRWLDPLGKHPAETATSAAVERPQAKPKKAHADKPAQAVLAWPVRASAVDDADKNDAFANRIQYAASQFKPPVFVPPPAPAVQPPPQPVVPVEPPPELKVIGTWGVEPNIAVFLEGPQGTVLAKAGEPLLGEYTVQSITKQQIVLLNQRTQKIWPLAIPDAPSVLTTWPSR